MSATAMHLVQMTTTMGFSVTAQQVVPTNSVKQSSSTACLVCATKMAHASVRISPTVPFASAALGSRVATVLRHSPRVGTPLARTVVSVKVAVAGMSSTACALHRTRVTGVRERWQLVTM